MSASVLLPIPADRVSDVWPHVKDMLQSAVDSANGRWALADIKRFLHEKDLVLWTSLREGKIEAVAITEIVQHSRKKMCMVKVLTGKDYANWVQLESGIAAWAESIGCAGMEAIARKGWARVFKNYDFTHILLERMF